ncbi:hypothetical protein NPX13_g8150 [Xylaria arbuscula]|uniref:Yippee/Mis18/Cereblon domain-containing protein n=1 Tax=Xylaria arbuscula TaxID=114810 RepID=A0A9W8TIL6_9PEZI|nr:hypothetical protein NPX13_g8150 [Xylaria arbuscula]
MDIASISCSQCHHDLGTLLNLWTQIGKSYISPVVHTCTALDVTPDGAIKHGEKGTIVENCRVQQVICTLCRSVLGSKCLGSAVNHVLQEGSLLFRVSSIHIKDPNGHDTIRPIIERALSLKNPPSHASQDDNGAPSYKEYDREQGAAEHPGIECILDKIDAQGEQIERLDTAGIQVVASLDRSLQQIGETIRIMKDDMTCAKRELLNNSNKTRELANDVLSTQTEVEKVKRTLQPLIVESHLEQERLSIDAAISEAKVSLGVEFSSMCDTYLETADLLESKLENMQRDLKEFRNTAHAALLESKTNFEDIAALKSELGHLRQDLALERSSKSSSTNTAFTSHEVDIITSNITKIGNKASQIEPLQMELELLKSRMQRIEAQAAGWQREPPASTGGKQLQQNLLPDPDWGPKNYQGWDRR